MYNKTVDANTAADIDKLVGKVLNDIGDPEPPLNLDVVRDVLRLDKAYYSSTDHSLLNETVHRMKVAGKQIVARPSLLLDVVRKMDLRALWLPDSRRILLDSEVPSLKQRWNEAHEVGHSLIPWHEPLVHGDQIRTLSYMCHQQIEAEANYAAGRMLFLQDNFVQEVRDSKMNFANIKKMHKRYGNTITSTIWRAVESMPLPAFGMVSIHPHDWLATDEQPIRYFLRSPNFLRQFGNIRGEVVLKRIASFCTRRRGPMGDGNVVLGDGNGTQYYFQVECFNNTYDTLTLGVCKGPVRKKVYVS
jgi:hypothetical protein